MPWKTITRQQLYDEVWSMAVSKLAPKYNLSDVGFAKFCKRCDIPRPPRGFWAKLEAGKKVKKTPLPTHEEEEEIRVYVPEPGEVEAQEKARSDANKETESLPKIELAESLRGCHALVSATRQAFEGAKKEEDGILQRPKDAKLNLLVSRDQLRRSLLIFDALLKAFESLGHKITAGPTIEVDGQLVSLSIRESVQTIEEEFDVSKESINGRYDFFHERKRKKQVPGGRLTLLIPEAELHWAYGCRKQWKDAKIQRVENCLNAIVAGVLEVASKKTDYEIKLKEQAAQEAENKKRMALEAKQRAEMREQQKVEQQRLDLLLQQVSSWRSSREIRDFISYVHQVHESSGTTIDTESDLGKWLDWATEQADRLDPTINSPKSILDEVIPEEPSYSSFRRW